MLLCVTIVLVTEGSFTEVRFYSSPLGAAHARMQNA